MPEWTSPSGTPDAELGDTFVSDLVAAQAASTPNAIAVLSGSESINYGDLEAQATPLAEHLRARGVGPDVVVGLCLEPSPAFVMGALAIWKAGGAYLPLDPTYPKERIHFILKDAQVPLVLTRQKYATSLPGEPWKLLDVDDRKISDVPEPHAQPVGELKLDNLAYVIYTSGSTGQPKGVEITHGGLLNLLHWHRHEFAVTSMDRATQLSSLGFDAAVWEIWPYLVAGAAVHIVDRETVVVPEVLRDWIVKEKITISFVPTPLAERLITLKWPAHTSLRFLLTGADVLHEYPRPDLPFAVVNNYGPTECTVVATSGLVLPNDIGESLPAIGRPITNTEILLLNERLEEVPIGSPGEMHIGGISVARGYRNHRELTEERFIPHPSSDVLGARLFKTGDLACLRPDGQIAFLGRIDDQIKIRGYRIEPNEIVAALRCYPVVQASVVIGSTSVSGEKRLVAYLVPKDGCETCLSDLRQHLQARLPAYMVPEVFVQLESLPLNSNGKVDRAALPLPNTSNTLRDSDSVEPRTPIEKRMAEILTGLLAVEHVGVEDNFFLLGGHSLLGTQLIARIHDHFGVELPLRALFKTPTIAALSAQIEELLVARVEAMSEDEAQRILGGQSQSFAEGM